MKTVNVIFLLVLTVSCNQTSNDSVLEEIEITKSNAIELHDSLMADMGELNSIKKRLQSVVESGNTATSNVDDAILSATEADKSMWDWMHNFDVAYSHKDDSVTLVYFQMKLVDIKNVKQKFDSAFYKGNRILE